MNLLHIIFHDLAHALRHASSRSRHAHAETNTLLLSPTKQPTAKPTQEVSNEKVQFTVLLLATVSDLQYQTRPEIVQFSNKHTKIDANNFQPRNQR